MAKKKGHGRKKLHGAALIAHQAKMQRSHHGGHRKRRNPSNPSNPANPRRRRRRRNPGTTFVQALGKVLGGAAAMFGSGVLVTLGTAKIMPGHPLSLYGIPAATALLGAGIATKAPVIGIGVAAGAASPFVLPVASTLLGGGTTGIPAAPAASTVSALRAVAMSGPYRELNAYPRAMYGMPIRGVQYPLGAVSMAGVPNPLGAVSMGAVYAD